MRLRPQLSKFQAVAIICVSALAFAAPAFTDSRRSGSSAMRAAGRDCLLRRDNA